LPAEVVAVVDLVARVERPVRDGHAERRLEHEGLRDNGANYRFVPSFSLGLWIKKHHFEVPTDCGCEDQSYLHVMAETSHKMRDLDSLG
jgi:hypothetical protein